MKTVYQDEKNVVLDENSVERKPCINRESKSLDITIKLYSCHDINMNFLVVVTPPSIYHVCFLSSTGQLPVKNPKAFAKCDKVKCASCQFGKYSLRPTKTQTFVMYKSKEMELNNNDLVPGQRVSVDHFQSALPGRFYNSKGRTDSKDMFHGGCIFLDHAFGYIQVWHQVTFSANKTVKDKLFYECDVAKYGVFIQGYHTDNGVFTSKYFMGALIEKYQLIRFSRYCAAHQNGISERGIQTVIQMN